MRKIIYIKCTVIRYMRILFYFKKEIEHLKGAIRKEKFGQLKWNK